MAEREKFLKTAKSMGDFAALMVKVRQGSEGDSTIQLSPDECKTLVWAMQMLSSGARDG